MSEPNLIQSPDKKNMTDLNKPSTYTQPILTQTTNTPSFASKVASEQLPKRELAIVFNTIENIPQIEYLIALSKLISPKDITYASRVSNGRFCVYLSNKNTIDNLLANHQNITINNQIINIRRLINPAKKLILSNVCPTIPNSIIESSLNYAGFTLVSPIIKLRAGFNIEGFTHIMSFKRQIFVKPDDFENKPTSIIINHEDIAYRIFINDDMVTCFHCKLKGHISNQCPNLKTQLVQNETHNIATPETKINENMTLGNEPNPELNEDINNI
ncbi:DNA replication licensing factor MCM4-like, partial [Aphis craccivora]